MGAETVFLMDMEESMIFWPVLSNGDVRGREQESKSSVICLKDAN